MSRHARDPLHHVCVDRQTYHAMALYVTGWVCAGVLAWVRCPLWLTVVVLVVTVLAIPALELVWDAEERRRARLTDQDRAAGRW